MALQAELLSGQGILVLTPAGPLAAADFAAAAALADPWIEQHGKLAGLIIHAKSFPGWEDFSGLVAHLKFVRAHHNEVLRIALVTDSTLRSIGPALARHFISAEVKAFDYGQRDEALAWLRAA